MNLKHVSKWFIPALAATIAGVLSYGIARYVAYRAAGTECDRLQTASFLKQELNLSDVQAGKLRAFNDELAATLDEVYTSHCRARARLGHALAGETNGCTRAESALNDMCRAYEDSERAVLNHIRHVRALLDPEQLEKFDGMLKACLCRECPLCGASEDYGLKFEHKH